MTTPKDIWQIIANILSLPLDDAKRIYDKARAGGEFNDITTAESWLNERFLPNIVWIDESGYTKMCVDALKILRSTAATDYGSSRQRDMGQLWADMTRGYLAEYAFLLYLKDKWHVQADLGHEQGLLSEYLPSDIHRIVKSEGELPREPNTNIGIKGTKWNGIWLDIPGAQFHHSNVHVLIKVGTGRDHLFAFFKHISVFKDKVLKRGIEIGSLSKNEADSLFESLPHFQDIPAYISGFVHHEMQFLELPYEGKIGRTNYTITGWCGEIKSGDLARIRQFENVGNGKIQFEGIGSFSHDNGYLFNVGNLLWQTEDWQNFVIEKL